MGNTYVWPKGNARKSTQDQQRKGSSQDDDQNICSNRTRNSKDMSGSVMCEDCYGQGYVMIGPDCDRPASMCCGGCYKKVECDKCNGKGYEKQEQENEDGE